MTLKFKLIVIKHIFEMKLNIYQYFDLTKISSQICNIISKLLDLNNKYT